MASKDKFYWNKIDLMLLVKKPFTLTGTWHSRQRHQSNVSLALILHFTLANWWSCGPYKYICCHKHFWNLKFYTKIRNKKKRGINLWVNALLDQLLKKLAINLAITCITQLSVWCILQQLFSMQVKAAYHCSSLPALIISTHGFQCIS